MANSKLPNNFTNGHKVNIKGYEITVRGVIKMENQKSEQCLSLDNFTDLKNIEAEIVKLISDDLSDYALYKQFENSEITKREVSTARILLPFRV